MRIELVEIHGDEEIRERIPLDNFPIQLGRGTREAVGFVPLPNCGGAYLSKLHCTVFKKGAALFLADGDPDGKPSHNGVWLDGQLIQEPMLLHPGQIFVLLKPPPCEVQIRVLEGVETLDDTLTPAIRDFVANPGEEAIERLTLAVNALRKDAETNADLDRQVRADLAVLKAEKGELLREQKQDRADYHEFKAGLSQWQKRQDKSQKRLVRLLGGTMLVVAILSAVVMSQDEKRRGQLIDISLQLFLGLSGAGGIAMSFNNLAKDDDLDKNSGDARPQEVPARF